MCVSSAPANFSSTTLYMGEAERSGVGYVHVSGYQNTAQNLANGPNAMLLHFPARKPMDERNIVDTSKCKNILRDMVKALAPRMRSASFGTKGIDPLRAIVFDSGIYTIILAADARSIPEALLRVPENKRPKISREFLEFYAATFPHYSLALCCFDNRDSRDASPMLWWYEPYNPAVLYAPGVDAHTGRAPQRDAIVEVDHWVISGSAVGDKAVAYFSEDESEWGFISEGKSVAYSDSLSQEVAELLPKTVMGKRCSGRYRNGDFIITTQSVRDYQRAGFLRETLSPPGVHAF